MKVINLLEDFRFLYLYDFNIRDTPILNNYPYILASFYENNLEDYKNIIKAYTLSTVFLVEKVRIDGEGKRRPFYTKLIETVKVHFHSSKNENIWLSKYSLFNNTHSDRRVYSCSENKFLVFEVFEINKEWIYNIDYDMLAKHLCNYCRY